MSWVVGLACFYLLRLDSLLEWTVPEEWCPQGPPLCTKRRSPERFLAMDACCYRYNWMWLDPEGPCAAASNAPDWAAGHAKKFGGYRDNEPLRGEISWDGQVCLSVYEVDTSISNAPGKLSVPYWSTRAGTWFLHGNCLRLIKLSPDLDELSRRQLFKGLALELNRVPGLQFQNRILGSIFYGLFQLELAVGKQRSGQHANFIEGVVVFAFLSAAAAAVHKLHLQHQHHVIEKESLKFAVPRQAGVGFQLAPQCWLAAKAS